jgi:crossover junction endodeoxyribonuclease RuvC
LTKIGTILGIDPGTNLLGFGVVRIGEDNKAEYVEMGVLDIRKETDPYVKLARINEFVSGLCERFQPDHMAIESPFLDKNAQVIFKLGRAQGAAMVAAASHGVQITEYAPRKAKIAICGNGSASKEQVSTMVQKTLGIKIDAKHLDATDALAIAMCHYYQLSSPLTSIKGGDSWAKFIKENPDRVK